jgi:hypothetical protein
MLSSPQDFEALAAARSITRLLAKHGKDWSDLAAHVAADPAPAPTVAVVNGWGVGAEMPSEQLCEIVSAIRAHGRLSEKAREFLTDIEARALLFPTVHLSPKQNDWLLALAESAAARMPS